MALAVEFLPVGDSDGDAILVKYGDDSGYWLNLVDGGYASVGETVIEHIHQHYGRDVTIHKMVVSHADNDHAAGLIPVFKSFRVETLWMNRPWLYAYEVIDQFHGNWTVAGWVNHVRGKHEYLVELENLARARGLEPQEVFQGAQIGPFLVLAPSRARYVSLIADLEKTPPLYKSDVVQWQLRAEPGPVFVDARAGRCRIGRVLRPPQTSSRFTNRSGLSSRGPSSWPGCSSSSRP